MNRFSVKQKIISIILFVTICSISITIAIDVFLNQARTKSDLINSRSLTTRLIAENSISTLVFDDKEGATIVLKSLKEIPDVLGAIIYDANDKEFAHYFLGDSMIRLPVIKSSGSLFENNYLYVNEPVIYKGNQLGFVNVIISTKALKQQNRDYLFTALITLVVIMLLATILAIWVQNLFTKPIIALSRFAEKISDSENYSLRIEKSTNDEIGILYDRFNVMIERIEKRRIERDKAEYELEQEKENLEIRVKQRTEELTAAMEKVEESDQLKSAFLANISHEIRTPMNAIIGFSEFLKDDDLSSPQKIEFIEIIHSSGNQLLSIINDIVEISKIETGQVQCFRENVNILKLCESLYSELSIIHDKLKVSFIFKKPVADTLLFTFCDRTKLNQVLANLITNAFKFTEYGSVEFGFDFNDENIKFYVKDSGIGIDKKYHDSVFERFRRIEDKNQKVKTGSGLGLSISKAYVELMGGTIYVESEPGNGSTFYFTIPNIKPENYEISQTKISKLTDEIEMNDTILIAEDDDINFKYLQVLFSNFQVRIIRAINGQEAVEKGLTDESINLVLMDMKMPILDGYEATRKLKAIKPNLPIIATTAYALSGDREKALAAGCDEYVSKPLLKEDIFEKIEIVKLRYSQQIS